jgi:hypothetical protein
MPFAFADCVSLISVIMGGSLFRIHSKAFSNNCLTFEGLHILPSINFLKDIRLPVCYDTSFASTVSRSKLEQHFRVEKDIS